MYQSRKQFKAKLKWCQNHEQQIKNDIIAQHHCSKSFGPFWKAVNKLNHKTSAPATIAGVQDPKDIADLFQSHFKVVSPLGPSARVFNAGAISETTLTITAKQVASIIKTMVRGKSPGHDGLSIEHLLHAGVHLPRVLSMFYTLCMGHCYLPDDLMRTVVVPIVKNKTGDFSELSNYRPISLATIVAKVLDSVLDGYLKGHLRLNDAQFGFRSGLSTESAIMCLKRTVQYYTAGRTPVFACYLDLSRAFDLVPDTRGRH
ncbi:uncharacterized protein LOC113236272 [Hyposmocoma kahamanoa]|uniref:uncharacterized protein LOC113236272 n=1 Tax=Hyposmocoma kahamanoa TaxID=1477025 RepID=UPI000E6D7161|nr:uncharacterized protein LOC113236272 [Hyposmocoma kahamanoa]